MYWYVGFVRDLHELTNMAWERGDWSDWADMTDMADWANCTLNLTDVAHGYVTTLATMANVAN